MNELHTRDLVDEFVDGRAEVNGSSWERLGAHEDLEEPQPDKK